jgi:hypothetical protein
MNETQNPRIMDSIDDMKLSHSRFKNGMGEWTWTGYEADPLDALSREYEKIDELDRKMKRRMESKSGRLNGN